MIVPSFTAKGGIASVVSGYRGSELEQQYQIRYIETYCDGGIAAKLWKAMGAYAAFLWELLFFRPDLVHVHSSFGASFYRKAPFIYVASVLGIPVVNHIHGSQWKQICREASERKKRTVQWLYNRCSRIIALSDDWKSEFSEIISSEKIEVIENYSIPCAEMPEAEDKSGSVVLFLGFLSELKGCMDIPEIAAKVRETAGDVTFVLAGSGRTEAVRSIRKLAGEYGAADCLVFPGWVRGEQKDALLRQSDLFLLPSYTEGMPMSVLEAMGYGLPVVSTRVGGIPQIVKHGETGFLCEPGDINGLAEAVAMLLNDPQKRRSMGQAGLDLVQEQYSLEKHINSLMAVYQHLTEKNGYGA